jgi:hypothetical protein
MRQWPINLKRAICLEVHYWMMIDLMFGSDCCIIPVYLILLLCDFLSVLPCVLCA